MTSSSGFSRSAEEPTKRCTHTHTTHGEHTPHHDFRTHSLRISLDRKLKYPQIRIYQMHISNLTKRALEFWVKDTLLNIHTTENIIRKFCNINQSHANR